MLRLRATTLLSITLGLFYSNFLLNDYDFPQLTGYAALNQIMAGLGKTEQQRDPTMLRFWKDTIGWKWYFIHSEALEKIIHLAQGYLCIKELALRDRTQTLVNSWNTHRWMTMLGTLLEDIVQVQDWKSFNTVKGQIVLWVELGENWPQVHSPPQSVLLVGP